MGFVFYLKAVEIVSGVGLKTFYIPDVDGIFAVCCSDQNRNLMYTFFYIVCLKSKTRSLVLI